MQEIRWIVLAEKVIETKRSLNSDRGKKRRRRAVVEDREEYQRKLWKRGYRSADQKNTPKIVDKLILLINSGKIK